MARDETLVPGRLLGATVINLPDKLMCLPTLSHRSELIKHVLLSLQSEFTNLCQMKYDALSAQFSTVNEREARACPTCELKLRNARVKRNI